MSTLMFFIVTHFVHIFLCFTVFLKNISLSYSSVVLFHVNSLYKNFSKSQVFLLVKTGVLKINAFFK